MKAVTWDVTVNWGDNSESPFTAIPGELPAIEHQYLDGPATHTVNIIITDTDGYTGRDSFTVLVSNIPPTVTIDPVNNNTP